MSASTAIWPLFENPINVIEMKPESIFKLNLKCFQMKRVHECHLRMP